LEGAVSLAQLQAVAGAGLTRLLSVWSLPGGLSSCCWSQGEWIPGKRSRVWPCRGSEAACAEMGRQHCIHLSAEAFLCSS